MTDDPTVALAMDRRARGATLRVFVILCARGLLTREWQPLKLAVIQHHTGVHASRACQMMRWLEEHGHIEAQKFPKYSKEYRLTGSGT